MKSLTPVHARLAAVLLASTLLATALPVRAAEDAPPPPGDFGPGGEHGRHGGGPFLHELFRLDLSDSQRAAIKTQLRAFHEQGRAGFESLRGARHAFETAAPNSAGYGTVTAQMADAASNAARDRVQQEAALRAQLFALLTDAQQAQLSSALANLPEPRAPRR